MINNIFPYYVILIVIFLIIFAIIFFIYVNENDDENIYTKLSGNLVYMSRLWSDNMYLTRSLIIEKISNYGGSSSTNNKLFMVQKQLGKNMSTYYGKDVGKKYYNLLKEHIELIIELIESLKINENYENILKRLRENGKNISNLLAELNPLIDEYVLYKTWKNYIDSTLNQAMFIIKKEYSKGFDEFENIKNNGYKFNDYISKSILQQFSD